jgi:uncharacterized protein YndB with AHSA1/START domain
MIDVSHQISAVSRAVGSRTLDAGEARTVTISQTYKADADDLWDACTNPERIPRWFLPISGELRVGGQYQLEGNANGTVLTCDPPTAFTATWEYGGQVSWIEVRVSPSSDGARFELEHIAHVDDELWAQFGPGAVGLGYDMAFVGLYLHLTGGGVAVDPAEALAWFASPEGLRFITAASTAWGEASTAAGTDPEAARAAAERTTAAYTAVPE